MSNEDTRPYDALALPAEALSNGGAEILRVGIIDNELYVTARRAFKDPARWGEVLADIARELALYHSAEDTSLSEEEILVQIEQAFAADLGAPELDEDEPVDTTPAPLPAKRAAPAKPGKGAKTAKAAKPAKTKARVSKKPAKKSRAAPKSAKRKKR